MSYKIVLKEFLKRHWIRTHRALQQQNRTVVVIFNVLISVPALACRWNWDIFLYQLDIERIALPPKPSLYRWQCYNDVYAQKFGKRGTYLPVARNDIHDPSQTHTVKFKSRKNSLARNFLPNRRILLKFCAAHSSMTAVLSANFRKDSSTKIDIMSERDFARFHFNVCIGRVIDIVTGPWTTNKNTPGW